MNSEILFYIIKLAIGGIVAFFAIMLMSKTRDGAWMSMVCGFLLSYASIVYDLMVSLGVFTTTGLMLFGIPLIPLLFTVVPSIFYIIAFIIMLARK